MRRSTIEKKGSTSARIAALTLTDEARERIAELGVLKALGFTHRGVLALVLAESCLIAVLGGALGLALAALAVLLLAWFFLNRQVDRLDAALARQAAIQAREQALEAKLKQP